MWVARDRSSVVLQVGGVWMLWLGLRREGIGDNRQLRNGPFHGLSRPLYASEVHSLC